MSRPESEELSVQIGRSIADAMGEPGSARLARQRAALVALDQASSSTTKAWRMPLGLALTAAAALTLWLVVQRPAGGLGSPVAAELAGQALSEGGWVHAESRPLAVDFSDGSCVTVTNSSRLRLTRLAAEESRLTLESGSVDVSITPGLDRIWIFVAGPYEVRVVGTEFSLAWRGDEKHLSVMVSKGKVLVVGGSIEGEGAPVSAGQGFEIGHQPPAPRTTDTAPRDVESQPTAEQPSLEPSADSKAPSTARPAPATPSSSKTDDETVPIARWKQLADAGEFGAAMAAAREVGLEQLIASAPAWDLLVLGDAARLSGNVSEAQRVLTGIRRRFPGSRTAQLAAFRLGRLAVEAQGNDAEAARWFETFLRESPQGDLAEGARGRLMAALLRLGRRDAARRVAKDYLRHHPKGRQAPFAESLISK